jgi:hypothetical protein
MLVFGGIASVAMLIGAIALLIWARGSGARTSPSTGSGGTAKVADFMKPATSPTGGGAAPVTAGAKRFTLRLGQGFRFKDGVVVVNKPEEAPDLAFKYVPPQLGGINMRYDPLKRVVEPKYEAPITASVPLLMGGRIKTFDAKPDVTHTTSGDVAAYENSAPISPTTRYALLQDAAGEQYLLTLDELEAMSGKYEEWRVGFTYEQVHLPVGLAGGQINAPFPGKLIFRDWYRVKMILRVDLTSGKEEALVDGFVPCALGDRLLGYADSTGAYVLRDGAGKTVNTIRFNDTVRDPLLSPDGTRVLGSVTRPGPPVQAALVTVQGPDVEGIAVFDLAGKEVTSILGYDDGAWTPDGKIIATGKLNEPGVFEIDPATKKVTPIDPELSYPRQVSVSPDGKTIALVTGNRVWLMDRDGKNRRQIFPDGRNQQRPVFSPDGTKVAFVVCTQSANDWTGEVFVVDLKTQAMTQLRTSAGNSVMPDANSRLNWVR